VYLVRKGYGEQHWGQLLPRTTSERLRFELLEVKTKSMFEAVFRFKLIAADGTELKRFWSDLESVEVLLRKLRMAGSAVPIDLPARRVVPR
jgi:hypothetical protein